MPTEVRLTVIAFKFTVVPVLTAVQLAPSQCIARPPSPTTKASASAFTATPRQVTPGFAGCVNACHPVGPVHRMISPSSPTAHAVPEGIPATARKVLVVGDDRTVF